MNALVIGKGGREHAIVKAIKQSPDVDEVHAVPGSEGFSLDGTINHSIDVNDFDKIIKLIDKCNINLVIVGPEEPLALGVADVLREKNILVFGPSKEAAQLEASKIISKEFMLKYKIPTAKFRVVNSVESVLEKAKLFEAPYVLKADGLAAGKGVFICKDLFELKTAAENIFEKQIFGNAGSKALLEQYQSGWELSYLILTNTTTYQPLVLSQDHKRLLDNDAGPNTGGMGVVAPIQIDQELHDRIKNEILIPTVAGLKDSGFDYRGVLYVGLMITEFGPTVIEYNVRFGDPEAQVILPLLHGDWMRVFTSVAEGKMPELDWKPLASACVVVAAEKYPESPVKDVVIRGDVQATTASSYFLHAGTHRNPNGDWMTAGGRVLNSVAMGSDLQEAINNAYMQVEKVSWPGMQFRNDIGKKVL